MGNKFSKYEFVKKGVLLITALAIFFSAFTVNIYASANTVSGININPLSADTTEARGGIVPFEGGPAPVSYWEYHEHNRHNETGNEQIFYINMESLIDIAEGATLNDGFDGFDYPVLVTSDGGVNTWQVDVTHGGLYNISVEFYPIPGRGNDIEKSLYINGDMPFRETRAIVFQRYWRNAGPIVQNSRGDDIQPGQEEVFGWRTQIIRDLQGYYAEPFLFYLPQGTHTISLGYVRDNIAIGRIWFTPAVHIPTYAEYRQMHQNAVITADVEIAMQAQLSDLRSSASLAPAADRSSQATTPTAPDRMLLNVISGTNWNMTGQWISWTIYVEQAGLYNIALRWKNDMANGFISSRMLTINGEIPFQEAADIQFIHSNRWRVTTISDRQGQPFLFYLNEGANEIRLEATTGEMSEIIARANESLSALTAIYRSIVQITSTIPDSQRDYHLERYIPSVLFEDIPNQRVILEEIMADMHALGGGGESNAELQRLILQLARMEERIDRIPSRVQNFMGDISGLAEWLIFASRQPLTLDNVIIMSPNVDPPRPHNGFFANIWFHIRMFFASFRAGDATFTGDYDLEDAETITVWIGSGAIGGRDQAQVLRIMIDNYFTPQTGINVNLQLVPPGSLLPATFAGRGPDVAHQLPTTQIMDFGLRTALADLADFDDFDEVYEWFTPQTWVPYVFDGRVFGVPETMSFPMLFYRRDVLEQELGITLNEPLEWDDIVRVLPNILRLNMSVWIPPDSIMLFIFLRQFQADLYRTDSLYTALNTVEALNAFRYFTDFYTAFRLPQVIDFQNRFRTGEIPIGIADYTLANVLAISAPEIRGLWNFMPIPGRIQPDGTLDQTGILITAGCVIMAQSQNKEAAWTYLKWWTGADMQTEFGRQIEAIMGPAGRYTPANLEALANMPWSASEHERLMRQLSNNVAMREMPGGYYTGRLLTFAIRNVLIEERNPRESLLEYAMRIDQEIRAKATELGIDMNLEFVDFMEHRQMNRGAD